MKKTGSLKKKELEQIPIQKGDTKEKFDYLYTAQERGKILVIDLFKFPNQERPILRAFFSRDEEKWISKKEDGTWSGATLDHLEPRSTYRWWWKERQVEEWRKGDTELIETYFSGKKESGYQAAADYQQTILKKKRLSNKHDRIKLRIDQAMDRVGDLPEDFDEWIDDVVMRPYRYIYYTYRGTKRQQGTCTHCNQDVVVVDAKHNQKGVCPNCQSKVIYKAKKKAAPIRDSEAVSVLVDYDEAGENKKVLRVFNVHRNIEKYGENCCTLIYETYRTVLDDHLRTIKEYSYGMFKNTHDVRWCEGGCGGYTPARIYPHNLDRHVTKCKSLALAEFAKNSNIKVPLADYTHSLRYNPKLEYLVKAGLYRLVSDAWGGWYSQGVFNYSARRLADYLRLDTQGVELCKKYDLGANGVRFLQKAAEYGAKIKEEDFVNLIDRRELTGDMAYLLSKASLTKLDRYIDSQATLHRRSFVISHYADYLRMCEQIGDDLKNDFVRFPRNLFAAHDAVVKRIDLEKARLQNEEIQSLNQGINAQYGMHFGGYLIKAPENAEELIKEGQELKHCVASYLDRIAKGETVVLLIRKEEEPDKPYTTMEVRNNRIVQIRGLQNKDMSADLKKLITQFKKEKKVS